MRSLCLRRLTPLLVMSLSTAAWASDYELPTYDTTLTYFQPATQQFNIPAGLYNRYTISIDWSPVAGVGVTSAQEWMGLQGEVSGQVLPLNNEQSPVGANAGARPDAQPTQLLWSGKMWSPTNGEPIFRGGTFQIQSLNFAMPSTVRWSDVHVRLSFVPEYTTSLPQATLSPSSPTLSFNGEEVPYYLKAFSVPEAGDYTLDLFHPTDHLSAALYVGSVDLTDLDTNLLGRELYSTDDHYQVTAALTPGTTYYMLVNGKEAWDSPIDIIGGLRGAGYASLSAVPEPGMAGTVLGTALLSLRRRRA